MEVNRMHGPYRVALDLSRGGDVTRRAWHFGAPVGALRPARSSGREVGPGPLSAEAHRGAESPSQRRVWA